MISNRLVEAHKVVKKKGEATDREIYKLINKSKGLTEYELSRKLNWTIGKTHGALCRLADKGLIFVKTKFEFYPVHWNKILVRDTDITEEELKHCGGRV